MTKILDCNIFDDYGKKEYKIKTEHKIFGTSKMGSTINGFIDDEDRIGVVAHGKEIYCYKKHDGFSVVEGNDMVIISDDLLKIFISV